MVWLWKIWKGNNRNTIEIYGTVGCCLTHKDVINTNYLIGYRGESHDVLGRNH